jgi:hypothetical protein
MKLFALVIVSSLVLALPHHAADPAALRAPAALAMGFTAPGPKSPPYAEAYKTASDSGKPLVVFVGQPAKPLAGCVCVAVQAFPQADRPAVVVGVPAGAGFRRVDLPGKPDAAAIRAATGTPPAGVTILPAAR